MTATPAQAAAVDRHAVEQFLFLEAQLADDHDYDGWEALWTDDALYWVPAGPAGSDPSTTMSIIFDNRHRIATRVRQLKTGRRHSQVPQSRLCRVVSNIRITGPAGPDGGDVEVRANFVLVESRERGRQLWAGRCTYRLRPVDGGLRLSYKAVELVDADAPLPSMSFLL